MNKAIFLVVLLVLVTVPNLLLSSTSMQKGEKTISKKQRIHTSIVIDAETGKIITESGSRKKRFPASMTKMMTAYLVFEALKSKRLSLSSPLKISPHAASRPYSTLNLKPGKTIALEDALCGILVKSANDAAAVLAEALYGSEEKAAEIMTEKARELGLTNTVFKNASGLHDPGTISTALDMAKLARALLKDFPEYYKFFGLKTFTYQGETYENFNSLLGKKGVDGIKTGNTDLAGFNLAISSLQNGRRLVAVVMNASTAEERDKILLDLIEKGFDEINKITLNEK